MNEILAKPCVGAIIEKTENNERYILIQTRQKEDGNETNGMLEIPVPLSVTLIMARANCSFKTIPVRIGGSP